MKQVREINLSYTLEAGIFNKANSKIEFGDNETALDNVLITGISVLTELAVKSPAGRAIFPVAELQKGFLTLADRNKAEYNRQLPMEIFVGSEVIIHIKPKLVSIRNSFIELPQLSSLVTAVPAGDIPGWSIVLTFYYDRYDPVKHKLSATGELED